MSATLCLVSILTFQVVFLQTQAYKFLIFPAAGCFHLSDVLKISKKLHERGHHASILLPDVCNEEASTYLNDIRISQVQHNQTAMEHTHLDQDAHAIEEDDTDSEVKARTCQPSSSSSHVTNVAQDMDMILYEGIRIEEFIPAKEADSIHTALKRRMDFSLSNCDGLLHNSSLMNTLREARFDMAFGDSSDFCFWPLSDALGIPRVDYDTLGSHSTPYLLYGMQQPVGYVPTQGAGLAGGPMTLPERFHNVWHYLQLYWARTFIVKRRLSAFRRKHQGLYLRQQMEEEEQRRRKKPSSSSQPSRASSGGSVLCISALDWAFQEPHPIPPLVHYVGPVQPEAPRPLPQHLEDFVVSAPQGCVVVSFVHGYHMLKQSMTAMAAAFTELHMRVVWHLPATSKAQLLDMYPAIKHARNVMITSSVPRNDLLGHPAVLAIMTDGSIHSIQEAIYHGKPIYAVPLSLEQRDVVARMVRLGLGTHLDRGKLERGVGYLVELNLQKISSSGGAFRRRAERFSKRMRAAAERLGSAADRAATLIEYV
eukprot:CAMPEP_0202897620 /NCGR_PEP_ID=MMETSP1392-20130828/6338_1 /ASSEMBLY_ACC=CAM_ASM_000868 /TAXON_ID=225041 /ORGANISM="Chlamydomonas chlamydogama, Strain SAG 11-48b" /LENGTH=537 /DNA_ID=CAMNT_0049583305 /DNA_START=16 /DNA_END=1626 /DNA_ORIENTATION=+